MKAPEARETINWGLVAIIGLGVVWVGSKMFSLADLFGFGSGGNSGDIYRNEQNERINAELDRATQEATERQQYWLDTKDYYEQGLYYHPEVEQAIDDHLANIREYQLALAAYNGQDRAQYENIMAEYQDYLGSRQAAISMLQRLTA